MSNKAILQILGAVVACGLSGHTLANTNANKNTQNQMNKTLTQEMPQGFEKCYGISKAGKNDCGSGSQACAGQGTADGAKNNWIGLPKGTCSKIVGGSTTEGSVS